MLQQVTNMEVLHELEPMPVPMIEQRRELRTRMVYRLVRVVIDGDEGLARCRNISDNGMKLELTMPVWTDAALTVAFSPSCIVVGRVVWAQGFECGLVFDEPIDASAMLRDSAAETEAERLQGLRLTSQVPARVCFDGAAHDTMSSELTPYGMKVRHNGAFRAGLRVTVMLGGRERPGVVRWTRGDFADVVLLEPFSVSELGSVGALTAY